MPETKGSEMQLELAVGTTVDITILSFACRSGFSLVSLHIALTMTHCWSHLKFLPQKLTPCARKITTYYVALKGASAPTFWQLNFDMR